MDYKTMLAWAERLKARCCVRARANRTQGTAYIMRPWSCFPLMTLSRPAGKRKAERIVKAVMPGPASAAVLMVAVPLEGLNPGQGLTGAC